MKIAQNLVASLLWMSSLVFISGCCCCLGAPSPPANGVQIKVNVSSLSDDEVDDFKAKLAAIAGSESNNSSTFNGSATYNYPTDLEPQAFADQIDFATVKSVEDRVITLTLSDFTTPPADDDTDDSEEDSDASADDPTDAVEEVDGAVSE